MKKNVSSIYQCLSVFICGFAFIFFSTPAAAQDWFRTGTGLGVSKARVGVADFAPKSTPAQPLAVEFADVVRNDLDFSGILDLVSKSYNPLQTPGTPAEVDFKAWSDAPASAQLLAFGAVSADANSLEISAWLNDVRNASLPPVIGKVYRGAPTDVQVRAFAHQFADEIIGKLSGGLPGIAATQIAFVSNRTGNKEIWTMDYDGENQHPLTQLHTIALTPRWSPDASRIAFTCYAQPNSGSVLTAQICIYSAASNRLISWPRFQGTNSSPAWSPDGSQLMFMSSMYGNPELFITDASGARPKRLTYSNGANTSPTFNPKTGQQVAFVSDRGGIPQLYTMNADGTSQAKVDLADKGYVIDPAWSPNGQLLAFSWRRPNGNYDLYIMEIVTHQLVELTRDAGRNERPSWAPDGRHIVFESTRTGTRQIWSMLADGTSAHQLTKQGQNESPNWSPK
ncbi:MAG: translocation protein TolB [Acidobacteriia bacterium]|nr:translocation protein TolB [Terriglobia bacterium]